MRIIEEYRASKIIYNFLKSQKIIKPFLLPANVCEVIPLTFYMAGVDFEFVDITKDDYLIDKDFVLQNINQYAGLLFVRTYGVEDDYNFFFSKLKEINENFIIIDDSCLSTPNFEIDKSIFDLKIYSLGYAKPIDLGVGAFGFVNSKLSYNNFETVYNEKIYDEYSFQVKGCILNKTQIKKRDYNFLDNTTYKIDKEYVLNRIRLVLKHKQELNEIYSNMLPNEIQLDKKFQNWRFNILVEPSVKDKIMKELFANNLFASNHYYPISNIWSDKTCKNAVDLYDKVINLFNDFYYTKEQAIKTSEVINRFL